MSKAQPDKRDRDNPDPSDEHRPQRDKPPADQTGVDGAVDDNIDDLGRDVTDGTVDPKRHPQLREDEATGRD